MSKVTKIWLIVGSALLVIGIILFALVMVSADWNFTVLSTENFEENSYNITEDFKNIAINTETADISFILSDDKKCRVDCYEDEKAKHFVSVENDTLNIKVDDKKNWFINIGININSPKVTVYLPKAEYSSLYIDESTGDIEIPKDFKFKDVDINGSTGSVMLKASVSEDVKINTSTGDINIKDVTANSFDLSTSTGGIKLSDTICKGEIKTDVSTGENNFTDVKCKKLTSDGSTGDIYLNNVIAKDKFSITRGTGSIIFVDSDANNIYADTSTGDITGSLLTDKVFITNANSDRVNIPTSGKGGRCELNTSTGDINIKISD